MSIAEWFKSLIKKDSTKYLAEFLPAAQVDSAAQAQPLVAERDYFRLWISEMYLQSSQRWLQTFYPVAHCAVTLNFGGQQVDISGVAGPERLKEFDAAHLDRVVARDYLLTPLLPFRGGTVQVIAGLFSVKSSDNALKGFLGAVEKITGLLQVPQLSAALAIAQPAAESVQALMLLSQEGLQIGLHQGFAAEGGAHSPALCAGYFVVMDAPAAEIPVDRLYVRGGRLHMGSSLQDSAPFTGATYLLFRLESRETRDDWPSLSAIAEPRRQALEALARGRTEEADTFHRHAVAVAYTSSDLTQSDRQRVIAAIQAEYREQRRIFEGAGATGEAVPSLQALVESTPPPANARARVDLERIFGEDGA